ncbi:hypothetical protein EMIT036CA2_10415 [Chryseobacterium sp. IT-36CA2]
MLFASLLNIHLLFAIHIFNYEKNSDFLFNFICAGSFKWIFF